MKWERLIKQRKYFANYLSVGKGQKNMY